jgi:hypothetical protein
MLRNRSVTVGKYYVNNARKIAREVLAADDQFITFNTYHLDTGNSAPSASQCTRRDFVHWADHEAHPTEIASLKLRQLEAALYEPQWPRRDTFRPADSSLRREITLPRR